MAESVLKAEGHINSEEGINQRMPSSGNKVKSKMRLTTSPRQSPPEITLPEAAKKEMQTLPSKTPVSVLQELLSRRGSTPKYELVQVEGAIHEPTFRYRVTVGDVVALGVGRSKKEAKHSAAKNVLDKLIGVVDPILITSMNNSINEQHLTGTMASPYDDKINGNPIGLLQELCMSRHWPPPSYDTEHEEGLPHERQFTIACFIFNFKEVGSGKSKKLAKRQAANKMWLRLKDINVENTNISFSLDEDDEINQRVIQIGQELNELKVSKFSTMTNNHSLKVSQFHKNLKASEGDKLKELQTNELLNRGFNFVQLLQEISSEQHFEVTYVDIEERSTSGKYQCLVQLSTLPVAVCHGVGANSKEAQTAAAYNALEYLKIMTKK